MAKSRTSMKVVQEKLVATMRAWQKIEDASVASTGRVIEKTENPIVRLVMEIIQRDSQMHHRVQGLIVDSMSKMISLSPEELGGVWGMIQDHIKIEEKTIELAQAALESIEGSKGMLVQAYLLEYLMEDEQKHVALLERLSKIQKGMYPYA
jgi:hypothetical protein